jgi:hypothetical protein
LARRILFSPRPLLYFLAPKQKMETAFRDVVRHARGQARRRYHPHPALKIRGHGFTPLLIVLCGIAYVVSKTRAFGCDAKGNGKHAAGMFDVLPLPASIEHQLGSAA